MIDAFIKSLLDFLAVFKLAWEVDGKGLSIGSNGYTIEGVLILDGLEYPVKTDGRYSYVWTKTYNDIRNEHKTNLNKEGVFMGFFGAVIERMNKDGIPVKGIKAVFDGKTFQYDIETELGTFDFYKCPCSNEFSVSEIRSSFEERTEKKISEFVEYVSKKFHRTYPSATLVKAPETTPAAIVEEVKAEPLVEVESPPECSQCADLKAQLEAALARIKELEAELEEANKPKEKKPRKKSELKPIPANPTFVFASKVLAKMAEKDNLPDSSMADLKVWVDEDIHIKLKFDWLDEIDFGGFETLEKAHRFMVDGRKNCRAIKRMIENFPTTLEEVIEKIDDQSTYLPMLHNIEEFGGFTCHTDYRLAKQFIQIPLEDYEYEALDYVEMGCSEIHELIVGYSGSESKQLITDKEHLEFHWVIDTVSSVYDECDCRDVSADVEDCDKAVYGFIEKDPKHPLISIYTEQRKKFEEKGFKPFKGE